MITTIITIITIITLVVLSVFPGLYVASMACGCPDAPSNQVVRIFAILIYSVIIGCCCEIFLLFFVIAYPFLLLLKFIRNELSVRQVDSVISYIKKQIGF